MIKNKRGFTLMEVVISLSLLLVLLAGTYMLLNHIMGTYYRTEKEWIADTQSKLVLSKIQDLIDVSYAAKIAKIDSKDKDYRCIYSEDGRVFYRGATDEEGNLLPSQNLDSGECDIAIKFECVATQENADKFYPNMVNIIVTAKIGEITKVSSGSINMPNMQKALEYPNNTVECNAFIYLSTDSAVIDMSGIISGGGCFIATAAYGSYDQEGVMLLRRFRDQILIPTEWGKAFVSTYYSVSPPIANTIRESYILKNVVRVGLLPVVGFAVLVVHPVFSLVFIALVILLVKYVKKCRSSKKYNSLF